MKRELAISLFRVALVLGGSILLWAQAPNPSPTNNFAGTGRGRGLAFGLAPTVSNQILAQGDLDKDQKISRAEFSALAESWFDAINADKLGRVSQEEFVERIEPLFPAMPSFGQRNSSGTALGGRASFGSSRFVGLFIATDTDGNGSLTRQEFLDSFQKWFDSWSGDKQPLDREKLLAGLVNVLPKTNFGGATGGESQNPIPGVPKPPPSPVLSPLESQKTLQLADGFKAQLAANEPMIEDPIALSFDEDGRLFVVELRSFMLDINRTGEREPLGRISLLEDTNGDGVFDKSMVFVDRLILPRSVAATRGGILFVADYKLWFAQDTDGDGKADRTELVDAEYGPGNVEHAPNGLMRAMDNWIYNAESPFRYRFLGNVLIKQRTEFRGQWGITQDNYGRLFYNVNNSQLLGDFAPPNYMSRNSHHRTSAGLNLPVSTDQRVFTIRMNTAVNRGYLTNVLDQAGKLYVFSSSCSPVVYRGENFPANFQSNVFVCDPSANLVKRNLVFEHDLTLSSRFAYENSEFLASTDERFRPSSIYNGPDGALWLVDMYRGIAQYGLFMTAYLRRESLERGLDQGIHLGRIYRIVHGNKPPRMPGPLSKESSAALAARLSHPNGWVRDTAQRLLVERRDRTILPILAKLAASPGDSIGRIHALWTIQGLVASLPESLVPKDNTTNTIRLLPVDPFLQWEAPGSTSELLDVVLKAVKDSDQKVQLAALRVAETLSAANAARSRELLRQLTGLASEAAPEVSFQVALSAGNLRKPDALPVLSKIATRFSEHSIIRHAILSGLQDWELSFLQILLADPVWSAQSPGRGPLLQALSAAVMNEREPGKIEAALALANSQRGEHIWRQRSLLDGLAGNTPGRSPEPVRLQTNPPALEALAKSNDGSVRQSVARIKKLLSWPGHNEESVSSQSAKIAKTAADPSLLDAGKLLFQQVCAGCHGLTGEGNPPLAPPLANSEWVLGPEKQLIRIALHGIAGPIIVGQTKYEPPQTLPEMPSLRDALDDNQIAAVLNYIRQSWGNGASAIAPTQIAKIRGETQTRETPWTETELKQIQ